MSDSAARLSGVVTVWMDSKIRAEVNRSPLLGPACCSGCGLHSHPDRLVPDGLQLEGLGGSGSEEGEAGPGGLHGKRASALQKDCLIFCPPAPLSFMSFLPRGQACESSDMTISELSVLRMCLHDIVHII